jgi:ribosomal protein S18 acetylase RimI-like enzyme
MEAFADYAMDASGTQEETMLLRMAKNSVDYAASPGAYDGNRLVGFTLIGVDAINGDLTAYDAGTGIVPEFRGQGLAKRMFDHALPALKERGARRFILEVLQENEPAIKAYQKRGFAIEREFRCYVGQPEQLRSRSSVEEFRMATVNAMAFEALISEADWIPSFENRFSAYKSIPEHVSFLGALDGNECVGIIAYCQPLNWLLSLIVKRSHRRRGVGLALVKQLADTMLADTPRIAALNVDGEDAGMQLFFESLGFVSLVNQYEMARAL